MSTQEIQIRPKERLLRIRDVAAIVSLSVAEIYQRVNDQEFPKPIRIGRMSRWVESEIDQWINEQIQNHRTERSAP